MPDVIEQLRRYGEAVERQAWDQRRLLLEPGARRRRRRTRLLAAAASVVLVAAAVTFAVVGRDDPPTVATRDERMMFSGRTGAVLLFSDGIDGVLALDLDNRIAARRVIDGERAGDQPFTLTLTGDALIVGWGEIYAAPLDGGSSTLIDTATIYLPAAEPGEVWTLDYPGGRIGSGSPMLRRVDTAGNVLFSSNDLDVNRYEPLIGVPGGLAVATSNGVAFWDAATGTIGDTHGPGRPVGASSNGSQFAWCADTCEDLRILDLPRAGSPTSQHIGAATAPAFSPDGKYIAFLVPGATGHNLVVRDVDTSEQTTVATGLEQHAAIQWAPNGDQLFYATDSYQKRSLTLGRYELETARWEEEQIPIGGGLGFVVLDRRAATAFLPERLGESSDCPPPAIFPSGRSGRCGFSF